MSIIGGSMVGISFQNKSAHLPTLEFRVEQGGIVSFLLGNPE